MVGRGLRPAPQPAERIYDDDRKDGALNVKYQFNRKLAVYCDWTNALDQTVVRVQGKVGRGFGGRAVTPLTAAARNGVHALPTISREQAQALTVEPAALGQAPPPLVH